MTPKNKMAAQYVNITTVMKHFLVVFAASLVLTRIESEDIRGVNYPHEIPFLHDYTLYREHDILFTSPVLDFGPPAIHVHVFLDSRIFRGVKPIFRLCPSLGSNQPSPLKLDFGSALFLILLSGQVELNPGPPISGSLNLSSIFPCGYCEDPVTWEQRGICCDSCDVWFHKDCVDMGSFTFLAYSTTNASWICCRCNHPNFDRNLFHSFEIETTNNFDNLNFSGSENVNSPNSDFAPTHHSRNFESKTQTDVVVLDFSKAFDVVPHQRLLHKLDHYGIRGTTLNWIQNFLTNRTQKVVVDGSSSESARVRSGVPQGTVLGPLLFLTYINDLPSTVSSQVRLFADVCLLYRPIKCRADQEQLQRDLSALQDWADRWGMCFNPSKCSVLRVSRPK